MNIHKEHSQMVTTLAKSGEPILASMTSLQMHRVHMAIGVAGEVGELEDILLQLSTETYEDTSKLKDHLIEEFGDTIFYVEGYLQSLKSRPELPLYKRTHQDEYVLNRLHIAACDLLDATKRDAIYQKTDCEEKIVTALQDVWKNLTFIMDQFDISVEQAKEANLNKLLKGKNARYASGSYSDDQANTRADKQ